MKVTPAIAILAGLLILALGSTLWQSRIADAELEKRNQGMAAITLRNDEKRYAAQEARELAAKEAERQNLDDQLVTWLTDARAALRASPRDQPGRILNLQTSLKTAYEAAQDVDVRSKISSVQLALGFIPDAEGLHRLIDRLEAQALLTAPQASR